jgi:hypothetical protein
MLNEGILNWRFGLGFALLYRRSDRLDTLYSPFPILQYNLSTSSRISSCSHSPSLAP